MAAEALHDGRFARIERMIGRDGLARLSRSFVCVVGLGAVGSYATEALARAGVGRLRLVDFDEVRRSNINRQLYATDATLGRKKIEVAHERVAQINPRCLVETMGLFVHRETLDGVLADSPDLVIDAIDSFTPKLMLLAELERRRVPLVSSMGAALRTDPTMIRTGPFRDVHTCPLAAKLRKAMRKMDLPMRFTCVYSVEPVTHLPAEAIGVDLEDNEDTVVRGRKRRTLGSLPTLTGIFGLTAANVAIRMLTQEHWPAGHGGDAGCNPRTAPCCNGSDVGGG